MTNIIHRRNDCRACGSRDLELVFNLEPSPIGDAYVTADQVDIIQPTYPIELFMCNTCGLAQLIDVIEPNILYSDYIYLTSSSSGLADHFKSYAKHVLNRCKIGPGSLVIDIGSNDGTLLNSFKKNGMSVLGIEPANNIAAHANAVGIETIADFFTFDLAHDIVGKYGAAKLITANNVFANIDNLASWANGIKKLLDSDGVFVFESYYLLDLVQNMVFDFIYHEHLSAFSVKPIQALFNNIGLELISLERVDTKGGSLRYYVQRPNGPLIKDGSVSEMLEMENKAGLYDKKTYIEFANKIDHLKQQAKKYLLQAKREGKSIAGFGASITGTTLIYHLGLGELLDYLIDDNLAKQGRFSPGLHLPVLPASALDQLKPDCVVILAWRFAETIILKNQNYLKDGGKFLIPVPEFKICQTEQH